ncbi:hypothetical protein [Metamycoplasma auris]|uniref:Uncharacterized protein n=1 Tax=Metamycoplasma auris TaxID=51363 RepID=A0A2W7HU27_9BACT|nr:hypothetical protein [Metamycoplasma auris]PZV98695.1 hypothetical protein BCF89_1163 [Metamycoplasma auris]
MTKKKLTKKDKNSLDEWLEEIENQLKKDEQASKIEDLNNFILENFSETNVNSKEVNND